MVGLGWVGLDGVGWLGEIYLVDFIVGRIMIMISHNLINYSRFIGEVSK